MTHRFVLHADLAASLPESSMAECSVVLHELGLQAEISPLAKPDLWQSPFQIVICMQDSRLEIIVHSGDHLQKQISVVPLLPLRSLIRDYDMLCKSHADALNSETPYRLEAIDMGRRGIHNEGAEHIQNALQSSLIVDHQTARYFFTLVTILYRRMGTLL